jgi:hypothetical protein
MTPSATVQAWLQDGPAAGAIRPVECGCPSGRPPELLMFRGGKVFVGTSDEPTPGTYATYELAPAPESAGLWPYWHVGDANKLRSPDGAASRRTRLSA